MPPGSGPSGSGRAGDAAAGHRTSTSRSFPAIRAGVWPRAISTPGDVLTLLDDPDSPFRRPETTILQELADDHGRRNDHDGAGPAHGGHLQAVQPQEMARPAAGTVSPLSSLAVVASRPASRQPRHPDAAKPGFSCQVTIVQDRPPFWFLPHETYLVTVKEADAVSLAKYVSRVLAKSPCRRAQRPSIRALTGSLAQLIRSLHERSLSHRDLKASNILVTPTADGQIGRLSLIDLVGVSLCHPFP